MKVIAERLWGEPAVFIGALVTVALLVVNLLAGADWDAALVITVLGPLISALGIRQAVTPTAKVDEALETTPRPVP